MANAHTHTCSHHDASSMSEGKLRLSLLFTFAFVLFEALSGLKAHSLALLSDAGHNFTDGFALLLSWYALRVARKPASATRTYGYHRVGILTALFNAVTLIVIALFIFVEAFQRFRQPETVASLPMIGVATVAVLLNTVIALALRGEAKDNVNLRSAYIHMAGDALSAVGVILAGVVIHFTGWPYADPLISVLIGLFILSTSGGIVQETLNILLEGAPKGLDIDAMVGAMRQVPGVTGVHDLHVWAIADGMNALSCHLQVSEPDMPHAARVVQEVKLLLAARYGVRHSTLETECTGCLHDQLYCSMPHTAHATG